MNVLLWKFGSSEAALKKERISTGRSSHDLVIDYKARSPNPWMPFSHIITTTANYWSAEAVGWRTSENQFIDRMQSAMAPNARVSVFSSLHNATRTQQIVVPLAILSLAFLIAILRVRHRKGLRTLPGPFLASISSLDRLITAASGKQFTKHLEYHRFYGPLVRVGPRHVSFSDADLIPAVYGIKSRFTKVTYLLRPCVCRLYLRGDRANFTPFST